MANKKSGEYKPGEKQPEVVERWLKALRYRRAGWTYERIATKLGYGSISGAYDAVMGALKATLREPSEEVRSLELERLDRLTAALWKFAVGKVPNMDATDRILKIMDRRAKLLGLDAPLKIEASEKPKRITIPDVDPRYPSE